MSALNKVILIGHLGKDPDLRYLQSGDAVVNLSLATTDKWTARSGQKQERTEWHRVEVFGKSADFVKQYMRKGDAAYIEGSIRYEEWTDKDGNKRTSTKIRVSGPNSKIMSLATRRERPQTSDPIEDEEPPF